MDRPDLYVVLHIYKTAGQTLFANFRAALERKTLLALYVGPMKLDIDKRAGSLANPGWIAEPVQAYVCRQANAGTRCLFGHMAYYGVHQFVSPLRQPRYITFLRDPVERVISLYYYLRNQSPNFWHREIVDSGWSLEEWLEKSQALWMRNGQVRQLLLGTHAEVSEQIELNAAHLAEAKRRLQQFWFVGLTECFAADVDYLYGRMQFSRFSLDPALNATPDKGDVPPHVRDLIVQHNRLDIQLFEFAQELHATYVRHHRLAYHWYQFRARFRRQRFLRRQTAAVSL